MTQLQQAEQGGVLVLCSVKVNPLTLSNVRDSEGGRLRICIHNVTEPKQTELELEEIPSTQILILQGMVIKGDYSLKPQIIWQVCQGYVKLSTLSENGDRVLVGVSRTHDAFGIDLTSLQTYQATALSEVHLVCFSPNRYRKL